MVERRETEIQKQVLGENIFLFAFLILTACQTDAKQDGVSHDTQLATTCEAEGGVPTAGLLGFVCARPFQDAGQACTDGSQCEGGQCISVEDSADYSGQCVPNEPYFGCYRTYEQGQITPALCVD